MIKKYIDFLRQFVDKKYLEPIENLTILADRLLNGYYIVIFEVDSKIKVI